MSKILHPAQEVRKLILSYHNFCRTKDDGSLDTGLLNMLAEALPEEVAGHPLFVLHALVEPDEAMKGGVVGRTKEVGLFETLWRTWGSDHWYVRRAVVENPRTPEDTLRTLGNEATESEGSVREAAKKALVERGLP